MASPLSQLRNRRNREHISKVSRRGSKGANGGAPPPSSQYPGEPSMALTKSTLAPSSILLGSRPTRMAFLNNTALETWKLVNMLITFSLDYFNFVFGEKNMHYLRNNKIRIFNGAYNETTFKCPAWTNYTFILSF